jgi:alpha-glucosidase
MVARLDNTRGTSDRHTRTHSSPGLWTTLLATILVSWPATGMGSQLPKRQGWALTSPGGDVQVTIAQKPLRYTARFRGKPVLVDSPLGLELQGSGPFQSLRLQHIQRRSAERTWTPVWGKSNQIKDSYREMKLSFEEQGSASNEGSRRLLGLVVRAYDDGFAFRYKLDAQPALKGFVVERELTGFRFPENPTVWAATYKNFRSSYEEEYRESRLSSLSSVPLIGLPMLARLQTDLYAAIAEADLTDWAGLYVSLQGDTLTAKLSPRRDGSGLVRTETPTRSPWRVVMLASTPNRFIESNLIENLNPASVIADTSWIRPGMMAWDHWWSGDVKMNADTNERFIAFASEMSFRYQLIDWQWYGQYNKPEADITSPTPALELPRVLRFAREHGVREWLWLHSGDVDRALSDGKLDAVFGIYEGWGIAGVKIDFMNSDDQERVNWYHTVLTMAAKHHLMVDYHGAYKPTGMGITYPNLLTSEGVLGNEYNKFSARVTPTHKLILPFTRMLVGPMDFTPGGFLNRSPTEFQSTHPTQVMGSRAQELAAFVVYWSPLTCVADDPEHYRGQPGLEFLRGLPTIWDETRVLDGAVGEHIVIARRRGQNWFLGGMTADHAYQLTLPLTFLGEGRFASHVFADPADRTTSYESLEVTQRVATSADRMQLDMRPAGGVAIHFERIPD